MHNCHLLKELKNNKHNIIIMQGAQLKTKLLVTQQHYTCFV